MPLFRSAWMRIGTISDSDSRFTASESSDTEAFKMDKASEVGFWDPTIRWLSRQFFSFRLPNWTTRSSRRSLSFCSALVRTSSASEKLLRRCRAVLWAQLTSGFSSKLGGIRETTSWSASAVSADWIWIVQMWILKGFFFNAISTHSWILTLSFKRK